MRSEAVLLATAQDNVIRLTAAASVASYYADIVVDLKQLWTFHSNGDHVYLAANAAGILAGSLVDVAEGHNPLLAPARLLGEMWSLRKPLPAKPTMENVAESAERLVKLRRLSAELAQVLLVEATVEGATSQLVQGFALAWETSYTESQRFWLALSVVQGVATMSWALTALDDQDYVSRVVKVGGDQEVGIVRGTEALKGKLLLVPVRMLEVAARMGSVITLAVAMKVAGGSGGVWAARASTCGIVAVALAVDMVAFLCAGPPRTWRRVLQNLLVMAGPLRFPAWLPAVGPPARRFYAVRAVQVIACFGIAWFLLGGSLEDAWSTLSEPDVGLQGDHSDQHSERLAGIIAAISCCCALAAFIVIPVVLWTAPVAIPDQVRADWAALVGGGGERAQEAAGSPFPLVDEEERYIFEAYGLLPGRAEVQAMRGIEMALGLGRTHYRRVATEENDAHRPELAQALRRLRQQEAREARAAADASQAAPGGSADEPQQDVEAGPPQQEDGTPQGAVRVNGLEGALGALQGGTAALVQELEVEDLDDANAERLAPALREMRALRVLTLPLSYSLTPEGWGVLSKALLAGGAASLRELHLRGCDLDDAKAGQLAPALGALPALRRLGLRYNGRLTSSGLAQVPWPALPRLRVVLRDAAGHEASARACPSEVLGVETLEIFGLRAFCPALPFCRSLASLEVRPGPGLEAADWASAAEALASGPAAGTLRTLSVFACGLDAERGAALAARLGELRALEEVKVRANSAEAQQAVARAVEGRGVRVLRD